MGRFFTVAAGLLTLLALQASGTKAATSQLVLPPSLRVTITLKGFHHGPQFAAHGEGRFIISGAISDRGTFVYRWPGMIHPPHDPYSLTLSGTKGTIRISGDGITGDGRRNHWRVEGGTSAFAGLGGQGRVQGGYTVLHCRPHCSRVIDVTMIGKVWQ